MLGYRADGDLCRNVPNARRIMPYLMGRRNESIVFFEQSIDPAGSLDFLAEVRERTGLRATLTHLVVWALARTLHERPRLNRFVAGHRIYQRRGIWVSSSGKKQKSDDAPMVVMKMRIEPEAPFEELVRSLTEDVERHRSDVPTATDRELSLLFKLPGVLLSLLVRVQRCLDRLGLLPSAVIRSDPLYASAFVGNLGSLGPMEAPFHHLYEYGTISMFLAVGAIRKQVVPGPDDQPVVAERMPIRYAFDERVEDGLYCLKSLERFRELLETPARA